VSDPAATPCSTAAWAASWARPWIANVSFAPSSRLDGALRSFTSASKGSVSQWASNSATAV
jgi:hypothetical protein